MRAPLLSGLTALVLVVPLGAQTQEPTTRPQGGPGRAGLGNPASTRFDAVVNRLEERLELTAEQKAQYDKMVAKYQVRADQQAGNREQQRALTQQYREARQAGDEAKAAELRKQMQEFRTGHTQLFEDFFAELEPILAPAQVEKLDAFRERLQQMGPAGGSATELQAVLRAARRLDLKDEQKARLHQIVREARAAERNGPLDPQAAAELAKRVKTQILELLDANQAAEFERLLARATSRPGRPDLRHRGGEGAPGAPGNAGGQQRQRQRNH